MATFDPRYASVPYNGNRPPIGQGALSNAWYSGGNSGTSFPTATPAKAPVAVPKDTRDYSKDISKTPGMSANMPTLGFNGMTTFPQYSPETMSMTSRKVLESAAKIKQAQQAQNAQQPQQQQHATQPAQVTPEEIASAKASKRLTKRHVDYVVSLNPGTDPVTIVKGLISKGYAIEGLNAPVSEPQQPSAPVQQAQEQPPEGGRSMTFLESMGKSAKSLVGGAGVVAGSIPKLVGGVVDIGEELLGGGDGIGEKIKGAGEALQEKSLDYAGIEGDTMRGASKFVSDVGLPVGGLFNIGSKALKGTEVVQKASGIISKVPGAGKVASAATSPIGKAMGVGAVGTAMVPGADLGDITTGAAISGAFPLAGMALKPAKDLVTGIIGASTGKGKAAIDTAWASRRKPAFQKTQNLEAIADTAKAGVANIRSNRKAMYGTAYDVFEEQSKKLGKIATDDVIKMADDSLDDFLKAKAVIRWSEKRKGAQTDSNFVGPIMKTKKTSIEKSGDLSLQVTDNADKELISNVYEEIQSYGKGATLEQLESLKGNIVSAMKSAKQGTKTYGALERIRDGITKKIEGVSPVYKKMNEHYSRISGAIEDIEKTLSLGGKANTQTAITKLSQVLKDKQNDVFKREVVKQLETLSGDKDIMARLASASLDNWLPEGLARVGLGTAAGGAAGYFISGGDVQSTPLNMFLGMLLLGSPRGQKELAIAVGKSESFIANLANKYQKSVNLAKGAQVPNKVSLKYLTKNAKETLDANDASIAFDKGQRVFKVSQFDEDMGDLVPEEVTSVKQFFDGRGEGTYFILPQVASSAKKKAIETVEKVGGAVKGAIKNLKMSAPKAASAIPRSMVEPENQESSYQGIINRR